jgi:hypothetical protein
MPEPDAALLKPMSCHAADRGLIEHEDLRNGFRCLSPISGGGSVAGAGISTLFASRAPRDENSHVVIVFECRRRVKTDLVRWRLLLRRPVTVADTNTDRCVELSAS